ncbi:MAG: hypothetical protein OEY65_05220, partial [Gammaproteobacteria bacterium]|nr:hypothetical protein [Gammaproteobacteria bacterium]
FNFSISRKIEGNGEWLYEMSRPEENKNISEFELPVIIKGGVNELIIRAKSPTVEREVRHQFTVYETPAEIIVYEKKEQYEVKVIPYSNLLRLDSVKVNVVLKDKSKHDLNRNNNEWLLNVDNKYKETPFTLHINAIRADGKSISMNFNKILSSVGIKQNLKLSDENNINKNILNKKNIVEPVSNNEKENKAKLPVSTKTDKKEDDVSWTMIIGLVAVGNIILITILGAGYLFIRKRKARMAKEATDQIGDIDTGESDAS